MKEFRVDDITFYVPDNAPEGMDDVFAWLREVDAEQLASDKDYDTILTALECRFEGGVPWSTIMKLYDREKG